jgi:hypothetical protein
MLHEISREQRMEDFGMVRIMFRCSGSCMLESGS